MIVDKGKTMNLNRINELPQKQRDSSFELLRIISMLSIVGCHFATHGGFDFNLQTLSIPRFWWSILEFGGNFGVNVFVLISGYFLIEDKSEKINVRKVLKIWGQVFFYAIAIATIFCGLGIQKLSFKLMMKAIFPIIGENWWFASTYMALYLLHPFLNKLLNGLDKGEFQKLVILLLVMWCVIPTFTGELYSFQSNNFLWFVVLYCVAAYIRKYDLSPRLTCRHYVCGLAVFSVLRYFSSVVLILIGTRIPFAGTYHLAFYGKRSILTFLSAFSIFMVFKNIKLGYNKWINLVASATFGVYLIHDNGIVRRFLWGSIFKNATWQDTPLLVPYSVFAVLVVYVGGTILELLRQRTLERVYLKMVDDTVKILTQKYSHK